MEGSDGVKIRVEDEADKWLREHDPYYTSTDKKKMRKTDSPYETPEQERKRKQMEIPFSNLSLKQRKQIPDAVNVFDDKH